MDAEQTHVATMKHPQQQACCSRDCKPVPGLSSARCNIAEKHWEAYQARLVSLNIFCDLNRAREYDKHLYKSGWLSFRSRSLSVSCRRTGAHMKSHSEHRASPAPQPLCWTLSAATPPSAHAIALTSTVAELHSASEIPLLLKSLLYFFLRLCWWSISNELKIVSAFLADFFFNQVGKCPPFISANQLHLLRSSNSEHTMVFSNQIHHVKVRAVVVHLNHMVRLQI